MRRDPKIIRCYVSARVSTDSDIAAYRHVLRNVRIAPRVQVGLNAPAFETKTDLLPMFLQAGPPAQILTSIPTEGDTVTHRYKRTVYDPHDSKIGEIMAVLVDRAARPLP